MTLTPFADAPAIATRLGRTLTQVETDQATAFLDDASWMIRDYCRQDLNQQLGYVAAFESPDGPWLDLPQRPVANVTSVLVNGQAVGDWSQVGDRLYRVYGWRWPSVNILPPLAIYGTVSTVSVTYDAGYATVPHVITSVCINAAMRAFDNPTGAIKETVDDYTRDFSRGFSGDQPTGTGVFLDPADQKRLRRFRHGAFTIDMGSGR